MKLIKLLTLLLFMSCGVEYTCNPDPLVVERIVSCNWDSICWCQMDDDTMRQVYRPHIGMEIENYECKE